MKSQLAALVVKSVRAPLRSALRNLEARTRERPPVPTPWAARGRRRSCHGPNGPGTGLPITEVRTPRSGSPLAASARDHHRSRRSNVAVAIHPSCTFERFHARAGRRHNLAANAARFQARAARSPGPLREHGIAADAARTTDLASLTAFEAASASDAHAAVRGPRAPHNGVGRLRGLAQAPALRLRFSGDQRNSHPARLGLRRGTVRQHAQTAVANKPDSVRFSPLHSTPLRSRARPRPETKTLARALAAFAAFRSAA